jgi:hypothetical protein
LVAIAFHRKFLHTRIRRARARSLFFARTFGAS